MIQAYNTESHYKNTEVRGVFSWEGDGTLPLNSYKPSQDPIETNGKDFKLLMKNKITHYSLKV